MVKWNPFLSGVCALLGGVFLWAAAASADVTSDNAAAIVVFPKLVLDADEGIDTEIQLSNTSDQPVNVRCFYVNANSHCSNEPDEVCNTSEDCEGGRCIEGWNEIDFRFTLTALQPIVWTISDGLPVSDTFPLDGVTRIGPGGQYNADSAIPGVPEDPFRGELKCIVVGEDEAPVDSNSLKGEATIVTVDGVDARAYNAVGIQAIEGANDGDNTLVLGEEYNSCPNILILDHFFDDAPEPAQDALVRTDLTLVPCSEDFVLQDQGLFDTTVQFLVYNEFEQRFSTSIKIKCFKEIGLSDIDTRPRAFNNTDPADTGDLRSIFNVNLQGTLTGQTRIRGVDDGQDGHGNGLLAVAEEFHRTDVTDLDTIRASAAFNVHQSGQRETTDVVSIP
jgi:hypothetical protein